MFDRSYSQRVKKATLDTLDNYAQKGWEPGGFCRAILENDLAGAIGRADPENRAALQEIVAYVYNELPSPCWGSREKVAAWLRHSFAPIELSMREVPEIEGRVEAADCPDCGKEGGHSSDVYCPAAGFMRAKGTVEK